MAPTSTDRRTLEQRYAASVYARVQAFANVHPTDERQPGEREQPEIGECDVAVENAEGQCAVSHCLRSIGKASNERLHEWDGNGPVCHPVTPLE